jgi:hypothetical protein
MISQEQYTIRAKALKKDGFERFLDNPLAKMIISDIPGESDKLRLLLKSAYDTGYDTGSADSILYMIESVLTKV